MHRDDAYAFPRLTWSSPSASVYGSMPLGNGEVGVNVWVREPGEVLVYLARTDAYDEHQRLLKVGCFCVKLGVAPFAAVGSFSQWLDLERGCVEVRAGGVSVSVWVDAHRPVVWVEVQMAQTPGGEPGEVGVSLELWRTTPVSHTDAKHLHAFMMQSPQHEPVTVAADVVMPAEASGLTWYHRNATSPMRESLTRQGLAHLEGTLDDPLLHRISGGSLFALGLERISSTAMQGRGVRDMVIGCVVHSEQATAAHWLSQVQALRDEAMEIDQPAARRAHERWWADFWARSWVRLTGDADAASVERGYTLQRYLSACAGRGRYPIKFNGSLFTVPHSDEGFDADYRRWGGSYWFQNTRLIYWPMLMSGDTALMGPFFELYDRNLPVAQARAKQLGSHGAIFPEIMTIFGTHNTAFYGYARPDDLPPGLPVNTYIRRYWTGSLELAVMMLDYVAYTGDQTFLRTRCVPLAMQVLRFFHGYFAQRDDHGRLRIAPSQALETWQEAENPSTDIAGLQWVVEGLLAQRAVLTEEEIDFLVSLRAVLPPLPTRTWVWQKKRVVLPALVYDQNSNWENPELYAVFPFRHYGVGKPELEVGVATYHERAVKIVGCWTQDAIDAAMLGLTEEARRCVVAIFNHHHVKSRFPAFWDSGGHNFDWPPDMDHGGVGSIALQRMLMQCEGNAIRLLPAWPRAWDVSFRLHAPQRTTVELTYANGEIRSLHVDPASRRADVLLPSD